MADHNLQLALYFLEMLYSKGPLPLNLIAETYQTKFFPQQVVTYDYLINETVLFLKQYPSLFHYDAEFVFPVSSDNSCHSEPLPTNVVHSARLINKRRLSVDEIDLALESEAVKYFQSHLLKKDEKWIPIKSLAGHLSQASDNVRLVIGNQSLFTAFLLRHSHVFDVQGELVGLKDNFITVGKSFSNSMSTNRRKTKGNHPISGTGNVNDCRSIKSDDLTQSDTSKSNSATSQTCRKRFVKENGCKDARNSAQIISNLILANASKNAGGGVGGGQNGVQNTVTIGLSTSDYKTIMSLHSAIKTIEETNNECNLANLMMNIVRNSSNNITNVVGFTHIELEEYLNKHALFFDILDGSIVKACDISNVNILINDNCNLETLCADSEPMTLTNKKGLVYHIAKLWGIIDLGQHEHVFFDKSIFKNIENLEKYFQVGEKIYFNAVLASKDSRAKWRATRVWKEADNPILQDNLCKVIQPADTMGLLLAEEIDFSDDELELVLAAANENKGKNNNNVALLDKLHIDSEDENTMKSIQSIDVEEEINMKFSGTNDKSMKNAYFEESFKNCNIGTQTLSTGEIMAMHFYHDHSIL